MLFHVWFCESRDGIATLFANMRIVQSIDLLGYPRIREDVKAQSSTLGGKDNQRNKVLAKSLLTKAFYDRGELVKATK